MPHGAPSARRRAEANRVRWEEHTYLDSAGIRHDRAAFAAESDARTAAYRVLDATGRRYSSYSCSRPGCSAWHIRPRPLRAPDMARPA